MFLYDSQSKILTFFKYFKYLNFTEIKLEKVYFLTKRFYLLNYVK